MSLDLFNRESIVEFWEKIHEVPVITIYLDTSKYTPDAQKRARGILKDFFQELKKREDVKSDKVLKRMVENYEEEALEWIEGNFRHLKNWVVMFLWWDTDMWEIVELPRPVKNRYYFEKQPVVKPLLWYMDEYKKFLVLVLDKRQAQVYLQFMGDIRKIEEVLDTFWEFWWTKDKYGWFPRDAAPWGGMYENADAEEWVLRRYVNKLWNELVHLKEKLWYDRLVVFVPEKMKHIVEEELHRDLKNILAKVITWNYTKANKNQIRDIVLEVEQELERQEENQMIEEIYNNIWVSDYKKWVAGLKPVLDHLNAQAVWYLLIHENMEFPGYIWKETWMLYTKPEDKVTDEELIPISDLTNDMITKAIDQDARVNFVPDNPKLKEMWGVAAMVRFKIE